MPFQQIGDPKLRNHLFRAVQLVKNADIDKYKYSGYGIGFETEGTFSFSNGAGFGNIENKLKRNSIWCWYEFIRACWP